MRKLLKRAAERVTGKGRKPPPAPPPKKAKRAKAQPAHRGYGYDPEFDPAPWLAQLKKTSYRVGAEAAETDSDTLKNLYVRMDWTEKAQLAKRADAGRQLDLLTARTLHVSRGGSVRELTNDEVRYQRETGRYYSDVVPIINVAPPPVLTGVLNPRKSKSDAWGYKPGTPDAEVNKVLLDSGKWIAAALVAKRAGVRLPAVLKHLKRLESEKRVTRRRKDGKSQFRVAK